MLLLIYPDCHHLKQVNDGKFIVKYEKGVKIVKYSCSKGYALIGNGTRTCLHDGTWTGSAPICNLNQNYYNYIAVYTD